MVMAADDAGPSLPVGDNGPAEPTGPTRVVVLRAIVHLGTGQANLRYMVAQSFEVPLDMANDAVMSAVVSEFLDAWLTASQNTEPLLLDREQHTLPVAVHPDQIVAVEFTGVVV